MAKALCIALTTLCADSQAAVVSVPNPAANVWRAGLASFNYDTYTYNTGSAGLFSPASFVVETFLDDNTGNLGAPVGALIFSSGSNLLAGSVYSHAGTVFSASTPYRNGTTDTFLSMGAFYDNAVPGANNYLGIDIADTNGEQHYGWLQYTFAAYSNGSTAVVFNGGYLNDAAGVAAVAGVVPEPSTIVIATVGACIPGERRRRVLDATGAAFVRRA